MTSCSWEKWNDYVTREIKIGSLSNFSVKLSIYRSVNMVVSAWWLKTENITFINKSFELSEKFYSFDLQRRKLVAFSRVQLILLSTWCFLLLLPRRVLSFLKFCFFNLQRRLGAFSRLFITFYQQEFWVFWKILLFQYTTKTCCFFKSSTWIKKIFCFFFLLYICSFWKQW
jgi:hypothetical protein